MDWDWLPHNDSGTRDIWHVQRVGTMDTPVKLSSHFLALSRTSVGLASCLALFINRLKTDLLQHRTDLRVDTTSC